MVTGAKQLAACRTMAALAEGRDYALSSSSETASAQKSVVRVKLTDSALRAIEDFQKYQVRFVLDSWFHGDISLRSGAFELKDREEEATAALSWLTAVAGCASFGSSASDTDGPWIIYDHLGWNIHMSSRHSEIFCGFFCRRNG